MNEPGFRFCGSCGARQDSGVLAGEPGQPKLVSDGAGIAAGAAEMMRPRRLSGSAGMSAADSAGLAGLAGRSRRPLAMLLVVDAALAIAGGLLLRAGLARPAEASAEPAAASSPSGAPATTSTSAPEEAAPGAVQAEPAQRAAEAAKPGAQAEAKAEAKPAPSDPPNAAPSAAAPASGFAPGEPTPGQPAAGAAAPGGAASDETPDKTPDKTLDKTPGAGGDAASDAAKKKKKADKAVRRTGAESPVDPYAPAADLSAQINKLFSKGQARLDKCHASMPRGADGAGPTQLTVSFRVMADGTLGGARVLGAPAGSEMLSMCVQAELAKWRVQSGESGEFVRRIQFGKVR
jgi:hypothetical protein